jgi:hypothetical protein
LDCERDIRERQAQGELVFLVVLDLFDQTWIVVKLDHLKAIKTVRPPNGNGSNDFYSVFENPATNGLGTPAAEFFCDLKGEL